MRQPLWLLNLLLIIGFIFILVFIFTSKIKIPERKSIAVTEHEMVKKEPAARTDSSIIYTKDLFGTLHHEPVIKKKEHKKETIPTPPPVVPARTPTSATVHFLEPLPITLTGIIFFDDKETNRAMIIDNRSKIEAIYKIEDEIEDAQVIKILKDRVILLRSNSQQEVLYLKKDINTIEDDILSNDWKQIITKKAANRYSVKVSEFTHLIKNLSDLIFQLNFKTAIKNAKPIGILVGDLDAKSLAHEMGLSKGDIIESINNLPLKTQQDKLNAYNTIINEQPKTIEIKVNSSGTDKKITYKLHGTKEDRLKGKIRKMALTHSEIGERHKKFSKTLKNIKLRDKEKMFKYKEVEPKSR